MINPSSCLSSCWPFALRNIFRFVGAAVAQFTILVLATALVRVSVFSLYLAHNPLLCGLECVSPIFDVYLDCFASVCYVMRGNAVTYHRAE